MALYSFLRCAWPAFTSKCLRWCLGLVLAFGAAFPAVVRFIGGSMVAPVLPKWVMYVGSACTLYVFTVVSLVLIREATSLLLRIFGVPLATLGRSKIIATAIFAGSILIVPYGMYLATEHVVVREVEVPIARLPAALDGLTIVQLTDIHASVIVDAKHVERVVEMTNALEPDLVVITGDMVDGTIADRLGDVRPLANIRARYGVFGVEGNHEHYVEYDKWMQAFPSLGITMLTNASQSLVIAGERVTIAGLTDPWSSHDGTQAPDLQKALAGRDPNDVVILLSHQPKFAADYADRVDLMLSGHTHGSQVLLMYPIVHATNKGFVRGLYDVVSKAGRVMQLYVSSGTYVWNGFPMRLGTRGEVTRLRLKKANEQ